jgi:hypothetical protein
VDAALRFRRRHALHPVHAGFELQPREDAGPRDRGDDLLVAAEVVLRDRDELRLPAMQVGIAGVHAEEIGREQRRLVAARAGPDLQDGAALVGGVLGQQLELQSLFQVGDPGAERVELLARHRRHLLVGGRIGQKRSQVGRLALGGAQRVDRGNHRIEVGELLGQLGVGGRRGAVIELGLDRLPALDQTVQLVLR